MILKTKLRRFWKEYKHEAKIYGWFKAFLKELPFYTNIREAIWWVKHRTTNVYHKLDLGLKPSWYDTDIRMLYACFALLKEFVEKELDGFNGIDRKIEDYYKSWKEDDQESEYKFDYQEAINAYKEIKRLYVWWKYVYPKYDDENPYIKQFDDLHTDKDHLWGESIPVLDKDGDPIAYRMREENVPEELKEKRRKAAVDSMEYELRTIKETEDNLASLIKIRKFLWT